MKSPHPAQSPADSLSLSDVIEGLGDGDDPKLSLREIVDAFGERGFGALILLLALMALFPWPPGGKAVFSAPIMLLSAELALQRDAVWLPRWVLRASFSRAAYRAAVVTPFGAPAWLRRWVLSWRLILNRTDERPARLMFSDGLRRAVRRRPRGLSLIRMLRAIERLTRPRLTPLTGEVADVVIGVICFLLALMMALPVPLGDMLPGLTLAIFGLALTQKDGLAVLAGGVGAVACAAYLALVWTAVIELIQAIGGWIGQIF